MVKMFLLHTDPEATQLWSNSKVIHFSMGKDSMLHSMLSVSIRVQRPDGEGAGGPWPPLFANYVFLKLFKIFFSFL